MAVGRGKESWLVEHRVLMGDGRRWSQGDRGRLDGRRFQVVATRGDRRVRKHQARTLEATQQVIRCQPFIRIRPQCPEKGLRKLIAKPLCVGATLKYSLKDYVCPPLSEGRTASGCLEQGRRPGKPVTILQLLERGFRRGEKLGGNIARGSGDRTGLC